MVRDDDDEVSFHPDAVEAFNDVKDEPIANGDDINTSKNISPKRKSMSEKFLEDNANYFQLDVLPTRTRSSRYPEDVSDEDVSTSKAVAGFHNSFLDFLKSKGVEGKETEDNCDKAGKRKRRKSGPSIGRRSTSTTRIKRPRSTSSCGRFSPGTDDESSSRSEAKTRSSRTRVRSPFSRTGAEELPSPTCSDAGSTTSCVSTRKLRVEVKKLTGLPTPQAGEEDISDDEEPSKRTTRMSKSDQGQDSASKRTRRSELDKLLEAVDTSFHFETAAAQAKRLSDSGLGPLEIDVSDSCDSTEENSNTAGKRKISDIDGESDVRNKKKAKTSTVLVAEGTKGKNEAHEDSVGNNGNNLLKTFSPKSVEKKNISIEKVETDDDDESSDVWDGWNQLEEDLATIGGDEVSINDLYFSFEETPTREGWFQTYR